MRKVSRYKVFLPVCSFFCVFRKPGVKTFDWFDSHHFVFTCLRSINNQTNPKIQSGYIAKYKCVWGPVYWCLLLLPFCMIWARGNPDSSTNPSEQYTIGYAFTCAFPRTKFESARKETRRNRRNEKKWIEMKQTCWTIRNTMYTIDKMSYDNDDSTTGSKLIIEKHQKWAECECVCSFSSICASEDIRASAQITCKL